MNSALVKSLTAFLLLLVVVQTRHTFPDTKDGFHYFMVFDTPIFKSGKEIDASRYELVWGASDLLGPMYRKTNPNIILTLYIPFSRDNELNTLEHWKSVHPDWIVYQCDKVTPAGFIGDAPHVPLDISNPEVIEWQVSKYAGMVRDFNYQGIAADNFALGNAMGGCGTWKNGVWNQRWNGQWWDVQYNTDVQNWLKTFYARIQVLSPNTLFGINFCLNGANPMDASVQKVTENVDFILDEAGYTNWGTVLPTPAYHEAMSVWIESIQSKGKHYFGINEFPVLDAQAKEWGMASYMMSKNERSSMVCTTIQGYGYETVLPEYDALNVGSPTASRSTDSNGLVTRSYSNGFAFVNPFNKTANYKIPDVGITYRDVAGKIYKPGDTVTIPGQTGKVMGVSSRITTITTVTTAASATTGGSGGSGAQGSTTSKTSQTQSTSSQSATTTTTTSQPQATTSQSSQSQSTTSNPSITTTTTTTTTSTSTTSSINNPSSSTTTSTPTINPSSSSSSPSSSPSSSSSSSSSSFSSSSSSFSSSSSSTTTNPSSATPNPSQPTTPPSQSTTSSSSTISQSTTSPSSTISDPSQPTIPPSSSSSTISDSSQTTNPSSSSISTGSPTDSPITPSQTSTTGSPSNPQTSSNPTSTPSSGSGSSGTKPAPAASSGSSGSKTSPADPTDPDSDPSATSSASFSASFFTILTLLPCTLLFLL